jgi:hypothetical protein
LTEDRATAVPRTRKGLATSWRPGERNSFAVSRIRGLDSGVKFTARVIAWCALGLSLTAYSARSQTIYGSAFISNGGASSLYSISPTDGAATLIGAIGFNKVSGIAFVGPILYGVGYTGAVQSLITINLTTGVGTAVGPTGVTSNFSDLSYRGSNGTLYGFQNSGNTLRTFNLSTGALTLAATLGGSGGGNAIDFSSGDVLYYGHAFALDTVNPMTGATLSTVTIDYTGTGITGADMRPNALEFDSGSGLLWASILRGGDSSSASSYLNNLVTINPTTGQVTNLGVTITGLEALAISPIPEPAACAACAGTVLLAWAARRRLRAPARREC